MRVLFAVNPEKTIFLYMVPLAWALRTAGHEVRVASQPGFASTITQAGLTAVPVGNNRDQWRITANKPELLARMRTGIMHPYDAFDDPAKQTWEYLSTGMASAVGGWHRVNNFPILADLVAFARSWRPDLVIWEPLTFAGAVAAKACGAAHARLLYGIDVYGGVRQLYRRLRDERPPEERVDPVADWLAGYGRRYGFEFSEDMLTGGFTIDQFPASLQIEAPGLRYVRTRYVPYGGPAAVPAWLRSQPARPRVGMTLGLTATEIFGGYNVPIADILSELSTLDVEVVATVADSARVGLARVPDNVTITPFVPWSALAPTCAAVIHHAGAATLAATALHPVPHLALHYHFDQPILARLLAAQGAGLEIHTSRADGATVRKAVERLLTEPAFRRDAERLSAEIRTLPAPNELAASLPALVDEHRAG